MSSGEGGGPPPVVLVGPSGAGKTTIARRLVEGAGSFVFSVSATTRAPRPRERHGEDYFFVDREEFLGMVRDGKLAEWAEVHGEHYGTLLETLDEARSRGEQVLLDIDVQGARQIKARVPDAILVFILPPSGSVLIRRLSKRGTESPAALRRRMETARSELLAAGEFDYVVVNDDLDRTVEEVRSMARGETLASHDPDSGVAMARRILQEVNMALAGEAGADSSNEKEKGV